MSRECGNIQLITGCMFSGKTEEVLKRVTRYEIAGLHVECFKLAMDNRFSNDEIISHSGSKRKAHLIESSQDIYDRMVRIERAQGEIDVITVDEIQFLDDGIIDLFLYLRDCCEKTVIASCLHTDFRGEAFRFRNSEKHVGYLMPYCKVTRLTAICTCKVNGKTCGGTAEYTQRIIHGQPADYHDPLILIGAKESYEARCKEHHEVPGKPLREFRGMTGF
ncbi:MAG: thymidine kinase [Candidatus Delongbacteria bacterium]|nr:thymidine kinase [Candidatus Delongbacteria bacterium]